MPTSIIDYFYILLYIFFFFLLQQTYFCRRVIEVVALTLDCEVKAVRTMLLSKATKPGVSAFCHFHYGPITVLKGKEKYGKQRRSK